jgi:hypothetical protein
MRHRDDDLARFRDDPLVQALTAPGSESELAGEAAVRAAFRESVPARGQHRLAARVGAGGTVIAVAVALSGGVAAAYTAAWPDSVQRVLHDALGGVGVPAPDKPPRPTPGGGAAVAPVPAAAPAISSTPTPPPRTSLSPLASAAGAAATGTSTTPPASATSIAVGTTSPSPSATGAGRSRPVAGAQVGISVSAERVPAGSGVSVDGVLTAPDGTPIAGKRVVLFVRLAGSPGWRRVDVGTTANDGKVSFDVPAVDHNTRFVLRAGHRVRSSVARVVVVPVITVQVAGTAPGAQSTTVTVTVSGADAGDIVVLHRAGVRTSSQQGRLDGSLTASFTVPVSQTRELHYRVVIGRTASHAAHALAFYVPPSGSSG